MHSIAASRRVILFDSPSSAIRTLETSSVATAVCISFLLQHQDQRQHLRRTADIRGYPLAVDLSRIWNSNWNVLPNDDDDDEGGSGDTRTSLWTRCRRGIKYAKRGLQWRRWRFKGDSSRAQKETPKRLHKSWRDAIGSLTLPYPSPGIGFGLDGTKPRPSCILVYILELAMQVLSTNVDGSWWIF